MKSGQSIGSDAVRWRWSRALLRRAVVGARLAAARSAKIDELSRAGKYAEAIPLAQAMLAGLEKNPAQTAILPAR